MAQHAGGVTGLHLADVAGGGHHGANSASSSFVSQCRTQTGGPVDTVVAGTAGQATRLGTPVVGLCCLGAVMALAAHLLAAAQHRIALVIEGHVGVVVVVLDQRCTVVDFVDHDREVACYFTIGNPGFRCITVSGDAGIGVDGGGFCQRRELAGDRRHVGIAKLALIGVANHAVTGFDASAAMKCELVVTLVAIGNRHNFALRVGCSDCFAGGRNEVINKVDRIDHGNRRCDRHRVGGIAAGSRGVTRNLDRQAVCQSWFVSEVAQVGGDVRADQRQAIHHGFDLGDVAVEGVLVAAVTVVHQRAGVVGGGARRGQGRCGAGHGGHHIANPLAGAARGAWHQLGQRKCQIRVTGNGGSRALGRIAKTDDREAVGIGYLEFDHRRTADSDFGHFTLGRQCSPLIARKRLDLDRRHGIGAGRSGCASGASGTSGAGRASRSRCTVTTTAATGKGSSHHQACRSKLGPMRGRLIHAFVK